MIYVNELTIAAISECMKEMETSSLPIFISSNLYSLLICIWLESHPHCFTQVGVAGEGSAAEQSPPHSVHVCLPLQWGAGLPAQLSQGMPQGFHLCQTPSWDIKLNSPQDFFMFFGVFILTLLLWLCRLCLPSKLPLAPPHTTASGT